jgi:hypothetical protein
VPSPSQFSVSSEAADLWRPNGDRLSYSDAAWCGASFGIVMHAALNFFSVAIPSLEGLLVLFAPAQSFAFAVTSADNPLGRWLALIVCQGVYWAIISVVLLAVVHGATDLVSHGWRVAVHHGKTWERSRSVSDRASAPPAAWGPRTSSASSTP